jgi:hypothetical protein
MIWFHSNFRVDDSDFHVLILPFRIDDFVAQLRLHGVSSGYFASPIAIVAVEIFEVF